MAFLIFGLLLWAFGHMLLWAFGHMEGRLFPGISAVLARAERPVMLGVVTVGVVLMVIGYRDWFGAFYWGRTPALAGINNLLMLLAVYCFAAAGMKTALARRFRHPMLAGVLIWVVAHLLVNGDTPSFVLFGGMGIWALAEMMLLNLATPDWTPPVPRKRGVKMELMAVLGTVIVYGAIAGVHGMLGYPVFG
ncbi:MAG TPA: NnrU family protein [Paenirhodobacter sp.]